MTTFAFTVPGCPVPWERVTPRGANGRTLTPARTRNYEAQVAAFARVAGVRLTGRPVRVRIDCYFPDRLRRDLDNIAKSILDGLQAPGLLPGDHWQAVPELVITGSLDALAPRAHITLTEVP